MKTDDNQPSEVRLGRAPISEAAPVPGPCHAIGHRGFGKVNSRFAKTHGAALSAGRLQIASERPLPELSEDLRQTIDLTP